MEKYIINGVEFEHDTFELVNLELFKAEAEGMAAFFEELESSDIEGIEVIRVTCERIADFFDVVLGEGTFQKAFGGKMNVFVMVEAVKKFIADITANINGKAKIVTSATQLRNREERRAAERAKKREEARKKIERKKNGKQSV